MSWPSLNSHPVFGFGKRALCCCLPLRVKSRGDSIDHDYNDSVNSCVNCWRRLEHLTVNKPLQNGRPHLAAPQQSAARAEAAQSW